MHAVIYTRISHDPRGEQAGVDRQYEDCVRYIERQGWTLVREYRDNDVSAYRNVRRPQYEEMLAAAAQSEFDVVVCYHFDRLLRRPRQMQEWLDIVTDGKCQLVSTTMELDLSSDMGRLIAPILAWVFEYEARQSSRRKRRELQDRAVEGIPHGPRSFGYCNVPKHQSPQEARTLEPHPEEAPVARQVYEWFLDNVSQTEIARRLNKEGFTTVRGRPWSQTAVRTFLQSPRNAGLIKHQGATTRGNWEALVDERTYEKALNRIGHWHYGPKPGGPRKYLLSGLIECGRCGKTMRSSTLAKNHPSKNKRRYACMHCKRLSRTAEPVEQEVQGFLMKVLLSPEDYLRRRPGLGEEALYALQRGDRLREEQRKLTDLLLKEKLDATAYEQRYDALVVCLVNS